MSKAVLLQICLLGFSGFVHFSETNRKIIPWSFLGVLNCSQLIPTVVNAISKLFQHVLKNVQNCLNKFPTIFQANQTHPKHIQKQIQYDLQKCRLIRFKITIMNTEYKHTISYNHLHKNAGNISKHIIVYMHTHNLCS